MGAAGPARRSSNLARRRLSPSLCGLRGSGFIIIIIVIILTMITVLTLIVILTMITITIIISIIYYDYDYDYDNDFFACFIRVQGFRFTPLRVSGFPGFKSLRAEDGFVS